MKLLINFFKSLLSRCQSNLETSMRGSTYILDSIQCLYYKCHRKHFSCSGYIDFTDYIKKKKSTTNSKHKDKCFQYVVTFALNYGKIELHSERVSKIEPFIDKYKWKGLNYPSNINDRKTFEKNNLTIALNVLYIKEKKNMSSLYLKNLNCKQQIILALIPNKEKVGWYYLVVKQLSALLRGIT